MSRKPRTAPSSAPSFSDLTVTRKPTLPTSPHHAPPNTTRSVPAPPRWRVLPEYSPATLCVKKATTLHMLANSLKQKTHHPLRMVRLLFYLIPSLSISYTMPKRYMACIASMAIGIATSLGASFINSMKVHIERL